MRKCIVCGKQASFYIPYARAAFCKEHFISFYEKRIVRTLKKAGFKGGRILVGVSGGKDSVALFYALNKISDEIHSEIVGLHLNLGIGSYSEVSEKVVRELMRIVDTDIIILKVKEEISFSVPDAVLRIRRPACAVCSIIKRWLLNKFAFENGFDYVATGHNMDDVATYYMKSLLTNSVEEFIRGADVITPGNKDLKLVGRLRPQLFLRELDNLYYVMSLGLPFVDINCPLSKGASSLKYKSIWEHIHSVNPIGQLNFVKASIKLKSMIPRGDVELKPCKYCGYATTAKDGVCAFCKIRIRVLSDQTKS